MDEKYVIEKGKMFLKLFVLASLICLVYSTIAFLFFETPVRMDLVVLSIVVYILYGIYRLVAYDDNNNPYNK